jgi:Family of unknown function (DUF6491)
MTIKKARAAVVITGTVTALAGCTTGVPRHNELTLVSDYVTSAGPPVDRFHTFRPYSWESVGGNQLVLWASPRDAYLITVWSSCTGLPFAYSIGLKTTTGTVSRFDSVLLPDRTRCPISDIRRIDLLKVKEVREARAAAANGAPGGIRDSEKASQGR